MDKRKVENDLGILSDDDIKASNDIAAALQLINQENVVTDMSAFETKKFIVEKNKDIKDLKTKASFEEKSELELDEIANQADQAFTDLMDISLNSMGKACGDIASAAQSFLTIKLNSRLAKMDAKFKKLNHEIQLKKLELASKPKIKDDTTEDDEDDIEIIEQN